MRNKIIVFFLYLFFFLPSLAENLNIQSLNITIDKKTKTTIFQNQVSAKDEKNNQLLTEFAEYNKDLQLFKTVGKTTVLTSGGFVVEGEDIIFDNNKNYIKSNKPANVQDIEKNEIYLDNFEYSTAENLFRSTGNIRVIDSKNNQDNFSQIYIDEKKKEIVGTDSKAFLNQEGFKTNENNKPRVFSNTVNLLEEKTKFTKSVFTTCDYRKEDKCPPWSLQATQMMHDEKKKTIFYKNAVIKVYDFPILFLPRLSHPDPSVDRRSGFLVPSFSDSKNLGEALDISYFWAIDKDKDFTIKNKLFVSENPLFLGEYRQAFEKSNLVLDFGYTQGYKKTSATKKPGEKSHFFLELVKNFKSKKNADNNLIALAINVHLHN